MPPRSSRASTAMSAEERRRRNGAAAARSNNRRDTLYASISSMESRVEHLQNLESYYQGANEELTKQLAEARAETARLQAELQTTQESQGDNQEEIDDGEV